MSDCGCIYMSEGELATFQTEKIVTARKPHQCCECGEPIEIRSRFELVRGLWDGTFFVYKTCLPCTEIRRAMCCDGWTYGGLWEAAEEFREAMRFPGCLDKLETVAAKAKFTAWLREGLAL